MYIQYICLWIWISGSCTFHGFEIQLTLWLQLKAWCHLAACFRFCQSNPKMFTFNCGLFGTLWKGDTISDDPITYPGLSVHLPLLIWVRVSGQQSQQGSHDHPLLSHLLQQFLWDTSKQDSECDLSYVSRVSSWLDMLENLPREMSVRHPDKLSDVPWPAHLSAELQYLHQL